MAFMTERVVTGIAYPADLVAGENEQTIYGVNIAAGDPNGSGQVFRVDMPNAPESMDGASITVLMEGLNNPCYLARARNSGGMVVQCYGQMRPAGNTDEYFPTIGQALLAVPGGAPVWPCQPIPHFNEQPNVHGPRGIALSPGGDTLYVFEDEIRRLDDYVSGNLLALTPEGKQYVWGGESSPFGPSGFYNWFSPTAFLKIDPAGQFLWVPGAWSLGGMARVAVSARNLGPNGSTDKTVWMAGMQGPYYGVGFREAPTGNAGVPVPHFILGPGGPLYRFWEPTAAGSGFLRYDYRAIAPSTTGEAQFRNLRGLCVTPGGQVFVSAGNWGLGGFGFAGYHLALGAPFDPGMIFRVVKRTEPLPPAFRDDLGPAFGIPTGEANPAVLMGISAPPQVDDHLPGG